MPASILSSGPEAYQRAADILKRGGLVGLPTETVYGLAGDARSPAAVDLIYAVKGRPAHNPLITHVLRPEDTCRLAHVSKSAEALMTAFWPGPLTLVLPRRGPQPKTAAGAGLPTIALRCPDAPWRDGLIKAGFSGQLVMPSANLSGHVSPTTAAHVAADLGDKIELIIDGGPCKAGVESTILKIEKDYAMLLRPGSLPHEAFVPFISDLRLPKRGSQISAPGMLASHYAPKARVRLNAAAKNSGEAYLGFGPYSVDADINLSPTADINEAAQNLYSALRALDTVGVIAVAPIPETGIGAALNDRLRRAAAAR